MAVSPTDLGTYLGAEVDDTRAQFLIDKAVDLCMALVSPLPRGYEAVVLDVAARAYANPTNVQSENVGPFAASYGRVGGGLWLTRQNKATLRNLSGAGGAFSIDMLPADAGQRLPWWDNASLGSDFSTEWP